MDKNLNQNQPIYMQIMDKIRAAIVSGELQPGQKMAPVRELAEDFGVNPNTMQRALAELEREGLLNTERTSGRFVTKDVVLIEQARKETGEAIVREFFYQMRALGFTKGQVEDFFRQMDGAEQRTLEIV